MGFTRKLRQFCRCGPGALSRTQSSTLASTSAFLTAIGRITHQSCGMGRTCCVCVRGVAYQAHEKYGHYRNDNDLPSLNRLFLMDNKLRFVGRPALADDRLDGLEDLKLFSALGRIWAVGCLPIGDPRNFSGTIITLVEFDPDLTACRVTQVQSPLGFRFEKNWAPFVADGALHFIYSCQPLVVLRIPPTKRCRSFRGFTAT